MAKIEQDLEQLFKNSFNCYTQVDRGSGRLEEEMAMTMDMFIEVVSNLLTEREANQANSKPANCAIFDVSNCIGCLHQYKARDFKECKTCKKNSNYTTI